MVCHYLEPTHLIDFGHNYFASNFSCINKLVYIDVKKNQNRLSVCLSLARSLSLSLSPSLSLALPPLSLVSFTFTQSLILLDLSISSAISLLSLINAMCASNKF